MKRNKKDTSGCIVCKGSTSINPITNKQNIFCDNENCKKSYRKLMNKMK